MPGLVISPYARQGYIDHQTLSSDACLKFIFNQAPRSPVLLATNPATDSPSIPAYFSGQPACVGCAIPPPALQAIAKGKKASKS